MKKLAALVVCLAAARLILGDLTELFIGWYSGVEPEIDARMWIAWSLQFLVNLAAIVLAWRVVRGRGARSHDEAQR